MVSVIFLIVHREMLDGGDDALRLNTFYIIDSSAGCEVRVFSHIFEVPAAQRASVDVHSRAEQDVHSACSRVLAQ